MVGVFGLGGGGGPATHLHQTALSGIYTASVVVQGVQQLANTARLANATLAGSKHVQYLAHALLHPYCVHLVFGVHRGYHLTLFKDIQFPAGKIVAQMVGRGGDAHTPSVSWTRWGWVDLRRYGGRWRVTRVSASWKGPGRILT